MSAPTYTVTEEREGWFSVCRDGFARFALNLNLHYHSEALLDLLLESRDIYDLPHITEAQRDDWREKRDALIAKITGKPNAPVEKARARLILAACQYAGWEGMQQSVKSPETAALANGYGKEALQQLRLAAVAYFAVVCEVDPAREAQDCARERSV